MHLCCFTAGIRKSKVERGIQYEAPDAKPTVLHMMAGGKLPGFMQRANAISPSDDGNQYPATTAILTINFAIYILDKVCRDGGGLVGTVAHPNATCATLGLPPSESRRA